MDKNMSFPRQNEKEEDAHRRSSSPNVADADGDGGFFEFFNATDNTAAEMCAAEDIFHPWKKLQQKHGCRNQNTPTFPKASADDDDDTNTILLLKRASSLNYPPTCQQQQQHTAMKMPRRAQSAKYVRSRNLDSSPSPSSSSLPHVAKPKWYVLMFGSMKRMVPGVMDMRDIRSRQNKRRNIPVPAPLSSVSKSRRTLLRGFSCKEDHVTTAALGCIPQF